MDIPKYWNLILTTLFPQADVPESPCEVEQTEVRRLGTNSWVDIDTSGSEMLLHIRRVAPPILSSLLRNNLQPSLDRLDWICQQCINKATQLVALGTGTTLPLSHVNSAMDVHDDPVQP